MSAAATQSPPTPRCPHCGARVAPEQDWCLECGAAVTTRVAGPPSWRIPVAVTLLTLGLLGAVVALTVSSLSDQADEAARGERAAATTTPARTTTAPARRRTATAPAAAAPSRTPTATATVPGATEATGGGPVLVWPRDREAYTVVVTTTTDRAGAERRARELIEAGEDAGVLRTDGYDFFDDGYWVVWAGQHPDRPAAERAQPKVARRAPGAYVTLIRRGAS